MSCPIPTLPLCVCALLIAVAAPARALPGPLDDKIDPVLLRRPALQAGGSASFLILLADQADLRRGLGARPDLISDPVRSLARQSDRGWFVFRTLKDHADRTQGPIRDLLRRRGVPHRSFWIANVIQAEGDHSLIRALAARQDVRRIEDDGPSLGIEPQVLRDEVMSPRSLTTAIEWGVRDVHADGVWELGFTGQGMVVANADTGVDAAHPALLPHYRGWDGMAAHHDYNWHDAVHGVTGNPCGSDTRAPCDDNGHGTHTTGSSVGDDGLGNQIGVAPGARFIACRNMDRGQGTPARYTECFQFFVAPTDLNEQNPDPDRRPHVINNSWGCTRSEGCAAETLQLVVENTQAAGIFVEVSAGNSGPGCGSVREPPALYDAAFATGAYDINGAIASFSSRGPAAPGARPRPDVVAPGVRVRSALPGGRYGQLSGTSMAGPHVTGVVALLWSARPDLLRQVDLTAEVLRRSARPVLTVPATQTCGALTSDFIPNHTFGHGRVDALAAVRF
jgi:subtilisin family serine protease